MSSPLAIAAVSAVLQSFLQNALIDYDLSTLLADVTVSAVPPDRIDLATTVPRINLFFFQATENQGWRNYGVRSRSANGDRVFNPPLALDLSYLLTAYGSDDFYAETLLGYAMFVLHEMPVFTRDAIREALGVPSSDPLFQALTNANLADQIEQIKIAPQTMSIDEMSKIWTSLQSQYRPTAVYKVSVVLIESTKSVKPTLPVRVPNILVLPFEHPSIEDVQSQASDTDPIVADQPILAGYNLVIDGQQLRGGTTHVLVDDTEIVPDDAKITDTRVIVPLPSDLQPGLHSVQVVQPVDFGTGLTSDPHRGVESNVAAFVLAPQITTAAPITAARNSTLTLAIDSPVGRAQRVALLAGSNTISIDARDPNGPDTTTTLDFPIPSDFPTGQQLLRVQIDGAESPLGTDTAGKYVSPTVKIT